MYHHVIFIKLKWILSRDNSESRRSVFLYIVQMIRNKSCHDYLCFTLIVFTDKYFWTYDESCKSHKHDKFLNYIWYIGSRKKKISSSTFRSSSMKNVFRIYGSRINERMVIERYVYWILHVENSASRFISFDATMLQNINTWQWWIGSQYFQKKPLFVFTYVVVTYVTSSEWCKIILMIITSGTFRVIKTSNDKSCKSNSDMCSL